MTVRYVICLVFGLIVFEVSCLLLGVGLDLRWFVDLPSALVTIATPLCFMLILRGGKDVRSAFSVIRKKETNRKELLNAKMFFDDYRRILFSVAFIGFIVSFVAMMVNLEVKEELGPLLALASISLLYAGVINMAVIVPYKMVINKKITETE